MHSDVTSRANDTQQHHWDWYQSLQKHMNRDKTFFQQYCSIDVNIAEALDYSESWFEQKFTLFCQSLCRQNA